VNPDTDHPVAPASGGVLETEVDVPDVCADVLERGASRVRGSASGSSVQISGRPTGGDHGNEGVLAAPLQVVDAVMLAEAVDVVLVGNPVGAGLHGGVPCPVGGGHPVVNDTVVGGVGRGTRGDARQRVSMLIGLTVTVAVPPSWFPIVRLTDCAALLVERVTADGQAVVSAEEPTVQVKDTVTSERYQP
jgi:hypothetical protein